MSDCPEEFSEDEWKWIKPLQKVLKKNGVKCSRGSLALMCEINNLYVLQASKGPSYEKVFGEAMNDYHQAYIKEKRKVKAMEAVVEAAKEFQLDAGNELFHMMPQNKSAVSKKKLFDALEALDTLKREAK